MRGITGRVLRLLGGLLLFGVGLAFMLRARLGLGPWDVLHEGLAERTGLTIGAVVVIVSVLVLVAWIPLRQRPGVGTVANAVLVGVAVDLSLAVLPAPDALPARVSFLALGIVLVAFATGLYIGAGLGPGPRDGLMTGLAERGWSIRRARTVVEVAMLGVGVALGGTVGIGTVAFAVSIGPLAHVFIPLLTVRTEVPGAT
ncbi:putative membrane protein YczE [Haloactinopolyspora alba]|uniref:Putative membrane protein YczE n=1 Tax=Haloactinopolyspora alba TaxID=648780 RepID=A0A2P8DYX4_9ACTN|nr:hypothetical protein [Haloactinopolyspora alba]PSL02411.1 putative membrane protein YczE [Haloactinopolyspora alba]